MSGQAKRAPFTNSIHAVRRLLAKDALQRMDTAHAVLDEASEQALRAAHIIQRLRDLVTRGEPRSRSRTCES
jgi:two-component system sensor kinase FixL